MSELLSGGNMNEVRRDGETVLRQAGPWSLSVHALLEHVRAAGIAGIPRPLEFDASLGIERLSFLEGIVPAYPLPDWVWDEGVLIDGARLLRRIHGTSASFPLTDREWQQPAREPVEVVCHNDFAPHNLVFDDAHTLIGVIDWDMCSPGPRLHDLAVFATRAVPLTLDPPPNAPRGSEVRPRIQTVLDAYGSDATPEELLGHAAAALRFLGGYSREAAVRLGNPELEDHAALYDRDASAIETGRLGGPHAPAPA